MSSKLQKYISIDDDDDSSVEISHILVIMHTAVIAVYVEKFPPTTVTFVCVIENLLHKLQIVISALM